MASTAAAAAAGAAAGAAAVAAAAVVAAVAATGAAAGTAAAGAATGAAAGTSALRRVVIIPGNGAGCATANFYPALAAALRQRGHVVLLREMPDADRARRARWEPFVDAELVRGDAGCVVVGHSSGALAALRLAERARVRAVVLVSATPSDLGDRNERASGWYDAPWRWDAVRANARRVALFASADDPLIPLAKQREVRDGLAAAGGVAGAGRFEYCELEKRSHFFDEEQPEILDIVARYASEPDGDES